MIFYNKIKNIFNSYFSVENKWFSTGFPSNSSWGWNKALPKSSLYNIGSNLILCIDRYIINTYNILIVH